MLSKTSYQPKRDIEIALENATLKGVVTIAENARGLVIFAHGSGSSRLSTRNNYVAEKLVERGFATLLFDLLTEEEDRTFANRFDIPLLTGRLVAVTHHMNRLPETSLLPVAYFGASTGAASAINAAAQPDTDIKAVVSRGGRPDLAPISALTTLYSPTLLLVGSLDHEVIQLNRKAYEQIGCKKKFTIIDGASHLFEEPGKLQKVTTHAIAWFEKYVTNDHVSE